MSIITVPFAALLPGTSNPRKTSDDALIAGLAASIRADGLLHNLVVQPAKRRKYRVIAGNRRYHALTKLKADGIIDGDYPVPVEVREVCDGDAFRLATIENVQREPLDPIDEAEAFATLFQNGAAIDDVAARIGTGVGTIRRRLALANLCEEAKAALRAGEIGLGVAEALTLGTAEAQQEILAQRANGYALDADDVRYLLTEAKPSVALAIFPLEDYRGSLTTDLFGDDETTYFDDVGAFFRLQDAAVEQLAEQYRERAAWVETVKAASVPWWQYRTAEEGETGGVVIHMTPSGRVEVREQLVWHQVEPRTAAATRSQPRALQDRPAYTSALVRYVALRRSAIVQAALLENPRKAKAVAAFELLRGLVHAGRIRLDVHPWLPALLDDPIRHAGEAAVQAELARIASKLAGNRQDGDPARGWAALVGAVGDQWALYQAVSTLGDEDLDRILTTVPLLAFGQRDIDRLDQTESLFNRVARDLQVDVRRFWRPDAAFLEQLKRTQLAEIAIASGASIGMGRLADYKKGELVRILERYFERTDGQEPHADEFHEKGRIWTPGVMAFLESEEKEEAA